MDIDRKLSTSLWLVFDNGLCVRKSDIEGFRIDDKDIVFTMASGMRHQMPITPGKTREEMANELRFMIVH